MAKLTLDFVGYNRAINNLIINGKRVKYKKKQCEFETTENTAEVIIYKTNFYTLKHWIWWELFCFVITFFGWFDFKHDTKFITIDCRFKINLTDNTYVKLKIQNYQDGGKFVEIETDASFVQESNIQYKDKTATAKHKKMKKIKGLATFIILAVIAIVIIL